MSTLTVSPDPHPDQDKSGPKQASKRRARLVAVIGVAVLAAGGLGGGLAVAIGGPSGQPTAPTAGSLGAMYSYYGSMMGSLYGGSMMGNSSYRSLMGPSGYLWMMGGANAPGWMRGGSLPGYMTGAGSDPGEVMGSLFANAPGPRVSAARATRLGNQIPSGATVDTRSNRITFSSRTVHLVVLASPAMPAEDFLTAGMVNPTIIVPADAKVTIELVNADGDMAHGLVITATQGASSWMPMMTTTPSFSGSAFWFLGSRTSAGMHVGTLTFTVTNPGTYRYLCPVPGHAQRGMIGSFIVAAI